MAAPSMSLGYIAIDGEEGQFRGASLVVDLRGIPMDFRYTDPIRPTRLERILYGSALDVYLREELILNSLIGAVEVKPCIWICRESVLLGPLRLASKEKSVMLEPSSHAPLEGLGSIEPMSDANAILIQADGVSAPLKMAFTQEAKPEEIQQTSAILVEAAKTMELLEPFGRIQKALASTGEE